MDYNLAYSFFANQPFFLVDLNVTSLQAQSWGALYDDYLTLLDGAFAKFAYYKFNSVSVSDINAGESGNTIVPGAVDYLAAFNRNSGDAIGTIYLSNSGNPSPSISSSLYDDVAYEYWQHRLYTGTVTSSSRFYSNMAHSLFNPWNSTQELTCLLYTSPSPRDGLLSRMPSSA